MPQIKIDVHALSADDTGDLLRLDLDQNRAEVSYIMAIKNQRSPRVGFLK